MVLTSNALAMLRPHWPSLFLRATSSFFTSEGFNEVLNSGNLKEFAREEEAAVVLVALNSVFQILAYSLLGYFYLQLLPGWLGLDTDVLDVSLWEIARIVLLDSAHIQEEDAKYKQKRHRRENR